MISVGNDSNHETGSMHSMDGGQPYGVRWIPTWLDLCICLESLKQSKRFLFCFC